METTPLTWNIWLSYAGIVLFVFMSTLSGVGGATAYTIIFNVIAALSLTYSVPLSIICVFGSTLIRAIMLVNKKHTCSLKRYLLDFTPVAVYFPFMCNTQIIGIILTKVLPTYLRVITIVVFLGYLLYRTAIKAKEDHKLEQDAKNGDSSLIYIDGISHHINRTEYELIVETQNEETQSDRIKLMLTVVANFLIFFAFTYSRIYLKEFSRDYWIHYVAQNVSLITGGMLSLYYVQHIYRRRQDNNFRWVKGDICWLDNRANLQFIMVSSLVGLIATYIGIGGGSVVSSILYTFGVLPEVIMAINAFTVMLTALTSAIQYIMAKQVIYDMAIICFCLAFVVSIFGIKLAFYVIKKYNNKTYIMILYCFILLASIIALSVKEILLYV